MMQQYLEIKAQHPDAILFYRMGDFYEMFGDDAVLAAPILGIALTTRDKGKPDAQPMCGVPHHSAQGYIAKLVRAGRKIALCEQGEITGKGLVPREVVQVITPGLITEETHLDQGRANYLMAVIRLGQGRAAYGIAFVDITTGELRATELGSHDDFLAETARVAPSEILVMEQALVPEPLFTTIVDNSLSPEKAREIVSAHFQTVGVEGLGLAEHPAALCAVAMLLAYVKERQKGAMANINAVRLYNPGRYMILGQGTLRNLEIFEVLSGGNKGSLFFLLNQTMTPMGGRRMADWLTFPLMHLETIHARLDAVQAFKDHEAALESLRGRLKDVSDLERIMGRVLAERATPRDLSALAQGLAQVPAIQAVLAGLQASMLHAMALDPLPGLCSRILGMLVDDPPHRLTDGNVIREGVDAGLDELRAIRRDSRAWIAAHEASERQNTGITSLKIGYNKVFGYYLEVTKTHAAKVPDSYIRKQTLVNAERFITPELKEYEAKLLGAQDAIAAIETRLFKELCSHVVQAAPFLRSTIDALAVLDVLGSLAWTARENNYTRPELDEGRALEIKDGRHPVVEKVLRAGAFVPNHCIFEDKDDTLHIITGPNMAGKSTYMRQIALITLLAQMGAFVPAKEARIGLTDRIFTRIGALDNLSAGQSTFLVEMSETANILHNATSRSLVILDEIGRGTSTYDGMALAWAVAEFLNQNGSRTFFATHYHELADLARRHKGIKNYHMAVDDSGHDVVFLREVRRGAIGRSYGIHVAKLAGVPEEVIRNARQVLASIDRKAKGVGAVNQGAAPVQASLFEMPQPAEAEPVAPDVSPVLRELKDLDLGRMTPLEALTLLHSYQDRLKKESF